MRFRHEKCHRRRSGPLQTSLFYKVGLQPGQNTQQGIGHLAYDKMAFVTYLG
jgi:hypothetical protein